jgi:hypothetical protein
MDRASKKIGRCVFALLPLAVALWLSHYAVNLVWYVAPGIVWVIVGALVGFLGTSSRR